MDSELLQRFQTGDPEAREALRNHLRSIAARVLLAPQWRLTDVGQVRELEQQAALAAMECGGDSPVAFATAAMEQATTRCIEQVRKRDGHPVSELSANLLARVALETATQPEMNQANTLLVDNPASRRLLDVARSALRTAVRAQAAQPAPVEQPAAQPLPTPGRARQPASPAPARRKLKPSRSTPGRAGENSLSRPPLSLILLVGVLVFVGYQRFSPRPEPVEVTLSWLLPQELPPTARAEEFEGLARHALLTMRSGKCRQAADRLHMEFRKDSEDFWLRYYEGLAWVCSREGLKALEALKDVDQEMDDPPFGHPWWLGQAQLLAGDLTAGLRTLDALANSSHPRAPQAASLSQAVREALD